DREIAELQIGPRFATMLGFGDFVPETLEHRAQRHARDGVIFGEEQIHRVRPGGFEPPTNSLEGCCSIHLSYGRPNVKLNAAGRFWRRDIPHHYFFLQCAPNCDVPTHWWLSLSWH